VNSDLSKLETSIPEIVRKINAGSFSLLQSWCKSLS
jgi:hypothetical protein